MSHPIIIVGAGWAGLAAAYTLVKQGLPVLLLEAAPQAGGRARGIPFQQTLVDNGQHLFLGAYQRCLSLLKELGISEQAIFHRSALWLKMQSPTPIELKLNELMPPLNLILGIITAKGLMGNERKAALRFCRELNTMKFKLAEDISVETLLLNLRQPASLITQLWEPLALAALSTPIQQASAQVFLNVLKQSFTQDSKYSNFLFPKTNLSDLFVNPVIEFLKKRETPILFNQRVQALVIENNHCLGVKTADQFYSGSRVILASAPAQAANLLNVPGLNTLKQTLTHFQAQPITTVYLGFDTPAKLSCPMIGFVHQTGQWVFDRSIADQPGLFSLVITGKGEHSEWSHQELVQKLTTQIKQLDPNLKTPLYSKVICEKSAAFLCTVNIDSKRPLQHTPVEGLLLAGDYTQAGYPASLEAAVKSGIEAAELLVTRQSSPAFYSSSTST